MLSTPNNEITKRAGCFFTLKNKSGFKKMQQMASCSKTMWKHGTWLLTQLVVHPPRRLNDQGFSVSGICSSNERECQTIAGGLAAKCCLSVALAAYLCRAKTESAKTCFSGSCIVGRRSASHKVLSVYLQISYSTQPKALSKTSKKLHEEEKLTVFALCH